MDKTQLQFTPIHGYSYQRKLERERRRAHEQARLREWIEWNIVILMICLFVAYAASSLTFTYTMNHQVITQTEGGSYKASVLGTEYEYEYR